MAKRKASVALSGAGRRSKRSKTASAQETFVWKPKDWVRKERLTNEVSVLVNKTSRKQLVVKKVLEIPTNDPRPVEIRALATLPDCNRVVKPLFYSSSDPNVDYGTAIFEFASLGDLHDYKEKHFDKKNHKPVPESHIWRCFVQIGQAVAFIQNRLGPNRDERHCLLHRDIKPGNILVVDNGTTYPSFKLHDFGVATTYKQAKARQPSYSGTYEWQPPENPVINTAKAEMWALGACIHFLAVVTSPIGSIARYTIARYNERNRHPDSARHYSPPGRYYVARVARQVDQINLSKETQQALASLHHTTISTRTSSNDWMMSSLHHTPSRRLSTERFMNVMIPLAREMLRKIGGQAALYDMDIKFGMEV